MLKRIGFYLGLIVFAIAFTVIALSSSHQKFNAFWQELTMGYLASSGDNLHSQVAAMNQMKANNTPPTEHPDRFSTFGNYPTGIGTNATLMSTGAVLSGVGQLGEIIIFALILTNLVTVLALIVVIFEVRQLARRLPPVAA